MNSGFLETWTVTRKSHDPSGHHWVTKNETAPVGADAVDGGLELPFKVVSTCLGHASIQITADRYGHLFPSTDPLAAAEKALVLRTV